MKSRLTKNIFISIAVVLMLFLSAFFVLKHFQSRMTKSSISSGGESETGKPETLPVEVKVVTVTSSAENIMLESQGKVMPSRTFSIPALSEGKVTRVYFNKGDFVGKGAALAVISNPDVNSDISSLNSKISINQTSIGILRRKIQESDSKKRLNQEQIKEDEAKLKDYREMLTLGLVTKNDLRNVKNGLRALQIESRNIDIEAQGIKNDIETKKSENQDSLMLLSKLKLRMENFRVSSPYSGYLIDIAPEGSFANYGQSLAAIASTGYEYVEALIPADQAGNIKSGQKSEIDFNGKKVDGIVRYIYPVADSNMIRVKVMPAKPLPLNLGVKVSFITGLANMFKIPKSAVVLVEGVPVVFTVRGNKAYKRDIKIGKNYTDSVLVLSGLNRGDRVIIENAYLLTEGAAVKVEQ